MGHPQLVSVLVNGGRALRAGRDGQPVKFKLSTDTTVNFLSTHHDIVFAIDVSFSTISSVSISMSWNSVLTGTNIYFPRGYFQVKGVVLNIQSRF